jgi:peptide deformylase
MPVRPILHWPDARLSTRCETIDGIDDDLRVLAADMFETMYAAPGRGLAAPQVGVLRRMFVMDVGWKDGTPSPVAMINPDILWMSEARATGAEGCLSLPGLTTDISRATSIRIRWTDLEGQAVEAELSGFAAVCAQHEFDHLDGIVTLMRLPAAARAKAEAAYYL